MINRTKLYSGYLSDEQIDFIKNSRIQIEVKVQKISDEYMKVEAQVEKELKNINDNLKYHVEFIDISKDPSVIVASMKEKQEKIRTDMKSHILKIVDKLNPENFQPTFEGIEKIYGILEDGYITTQTDMMRFSNLSCLTLEISDFKVKQLLEDAKAKADFIKFANWKVRLENKSVDEIQQECLQDPLEFYFLSWDPPIGFGFHPNMIQIQNKTQLYFIHRNFPFLIRIHTQNAANGANTFAIGWLYEHPIQQGQLKYKENYMANPNSHKQNSENSILYEKTNEVIKLGNDGTLNFFIHGNTHQSNANFNKYAHFNVRP